MTDDLSLDVLIAELETAAKGSAELSEAVARATGWEFLQHSLLEDPPSYTVDLAAAWSLMPPDHGITLHRFLASRGAAWAVVFTDGQRFTCSANTEALAICAAALKSTMRL